MSSLLYAGMLLIVLYLCGNKPRGFAHVRIWKMYV